MWRKCQNAPHTIFMTICLPSLTLFNFWVVPISVSANSRFFPLETIRFRLLYFVGEFQIFIEHCVCFCQKKFASSYFPVYFLYVSSNGVSTAEVWRGLLIQNQKWGLEKTSILKRRLGNRILAQTILLPFDSKSRKTSELWRWGKCFKTTPRDATGAFIPKWVWVCFLRHTCMFRFGRYQSINQNETIVFADWTSWSIIINLDRWVRCHCFQCQKKRQQQ